MGNCSIALLNNELEPISGRKAAPERSYGVHGERNTMELLRKRKARHAPGIANEKHAKCDMPAQGGHTQDRWHRIRPETHTVLRDATARSGHHTSETKLLPQKKHRRTACRRSSTSQLRAVGGSQCATATVGSVSASAAGGRNALRLQPVHVRTMGVERMKDVIEHRAGIVRPCQHDRRLYDGGKGGAHPRCGHWDMWRS